LQYFVAPFGGSALALIFYEFVFVKSQEYLADGEDDDETDADNDELANGLSEPINKGQRTVDEDQLDE
jgi:hypothetical protein